MCEYCLKGNSKENLRGTDGVVYDTDVKKHYLYIEHFNQEVYTIEVSFCPKCGVKLVN